jgi:hypothetical protein
MVRYLGYLTSKTAMLFCVSHYWIRLLKQLYSLPKVLGIFLTTAVVTASCFVVIVMPVYVMLVHTHTSIFIYLFSFMPWCLMI